MKLLGHVVSENGIQTDLDKVKSIIAFANDYKAAGYIHSKGEVHGKVHSIVLTTSLPFSTSGKA